MSTPAPKNDFARIDAIILASFASLKLLVHFASTLFAPYGYFRDEFYYLDCANHLSWGYVDQPPLSLLILHLTRFIFGPSAFAIRLPAAIAGAALVVMAGLLAKEMGGGRFSRALACLAVVAAPVYLTVGSFFSMNAFDPFFFAIAAYLLVRIINTGNARLWLWFGVIAGIALENKYTMGFFGVCLVPAMLFTPLRKYFYDKNLYLGGAIAAFIFLPHIVWEYRHHWITLEFMHNASTLKNLPETFHGFALNQLLITNPIAAPIWIAGLLWCVFSASGKPYRLFAFIYAGLFLIFFMSNGKPYYLGPIYSVILPMGAVCIESATQSRRWIRLTLATLLPISAIALSPLAFPVLTPESLVAYQNTIGVKPPQQERSHSGPLPQHLGDRLGWPELVEMIANAYNQLAPADRAQCSILVSNYGEAGAINLLGPTYGLPHAISGYMNNYLWGPGNATGNVMFVYWDERATLDELFENVTEVAHFTQPYVMDRQNNRTLYLCRKLKIPMQQAWPRFKRFQ